MTRPEDISERAWEAAGRALTAIDNLDVDERTGIARAIDAETERCAKVADEVRAARRKMAEEEERTEPLDQAEADVFRGQEFIAKCIARAIRSPHV